MNLLDSDSNRKMLRMLLKKLNIDASMAEDGKQGVEVIMERPDAFQLVFMDNLMPVMVVDIDQLVNCHLFRLFFVWVY